MKKRLISLALIMAMFISLSSGFILPSQAENDLPRYNAETDFGSDVFSYYARNISTGENAELTYVEARNMYMTSATGSFIAPTYLSVGINPAVGSMVIFTAPYSGTITISNAAAGGITNKGYQWNKADFAACYANVYGADWSALASYAIPASETAVATPDITNVEVKAGDKIKFMAGSNSTMNCYLYWIPEITYTEIEGVEHQHTWQEEWQFDEEYHWHDCTASCNITDNAQKSGYGAHIDENNDGKCDTCSYEQSQPSTPPSYNAETDFGSDVFSYYARNISTGENAELTYVEARNMYMTSATGSFIAPNYLSVGINPAVGSMVIFTAPYSGTITISNAAAGGITNKGYQWNKKDFADCNATIYGADWSVLASYAIPASETAVETPDIANIEVKTGDKIKFFANSNSSMNCYLYWIPVITYTEVEGATHQHTWQEEWQFDEGYHWHECTSGCDITDNAQKSGYGAHIDENNDGKCDACSYEQAQPSTPSSYNAETDFGSDVFSYYARNISTGENAELTYVEARNMYMTSATGSFIAPTYLSVGINPAVGSMVIFTAPYSGTITISNAAAGGITNKGYQWNKKDFAECNATIYGADWSVLASYAIPASETAVETPDITNIEVKAGDKIKFFANSNSPTNCYLYWIPVITYTEAESTEHTHTWQEEWQFDEEYHWHDCTASCNITDNAQKSGYGAHADENDDGKCDTCGYEQEQPSTPSSYNAETDFGSEVFSYYSRNISTGENAELTYVEARNMYMTSATGSYIAPNYLSVGNNTNVGSMVIFTAPYNGIITISNAAVGGITNKGYQWNKTDFAECTATIYGTDWSVLASYAIPASETAVETPDITNIEVKAGDKIKFFANSNSPTNCYLYWIPEIIYTERGHGHEWQDAWQTNSTHHWHECTDSCDITENAQKYGYSEHSDTDQNLQCDVCAYQIPIPDLETTTLSLIAPANGTQTQIVSEAVAAWLEVFDIGSFDAGKYMGIGDNYYGGVAVQWEASAVGATYVVTYATDASFTDAKTIRVAGTSSVVLDNLYAATKYYWKVDAIYSNGTISSDVLTFTTAEAPRVVYIDGVSNTRDLGGWAISDRTDIKQGMIYRGGRLNDITENGLVHILEDLGICTELDLRAPGEGGCGIEFPLGDGAAYVNHPIAMTIEILQEANKAKFANAVKVFAYEENYPIYIHCQVGRDRTGTLSFVLLGLLGASKEQMIKDYELSFFSAIAGVPDEDTYLQFRRSIESLYNSFENYGTGTVQENIEQYLLDIGVTAEEIAAIRTIMLDTEVAGDTQTHSHDWLYAWYGNSTHHWHECLGDCNITNNAEKFGYSKHTDSEMDGICDVCRRNAALPGPEDGMYSFRDMFSDNQNGVWKYLIRENFTNIYQSMSWDSANNMWTDGKGGMITKEWLHASGDAGERREMQTCVEFVAPYGGTVSLSMLGGTIKVGPNSNNGVTVAIWRNDADLYVLPHTTIGAGETYDFAPTSVSVKKGDKIRFFVFAIGGNNAGDSVVMLPVIKYTAYRLGPNQGVYSAVDMFSGKQNDIWQYLAREAVSNTFKELSWNGEMWVDGKGAMISRDWMHPSADVSSTRVVETCLTFIAPSDGVVRFALEDNIVGVSQSSTTGIRFDIMQNDTIIFTKIFKRGDHWFDPFTVNITKGDRIYFLLTPNGSNAGDSTRCMPIITYLSYEKGPEPVLEEVPDDPSRTYYNSKDDFGGYLNPWYYGYCAKGSQKLELMKWNPAIKTFYAEGIRGLQISEVSTHPYPGYDPVRVFRAPKSGKIRITMNDDIISVANGSSGVEDGVFVSIRLNDGSSMNDLYPKTLVLPGESIEFDAIELEIYKGWELWFVVNGNKNTNNDSTRIYPIVEYLEITDKEAPVYSNRENDTHELSLDFLNPVEKDINKTNKLSNIWILVATFVIVMVCTNIILILIFKRRKKR